MESKIKVDIKEPKLVKFSFEENSIEVEPYVSLENKMILLTNYASTFYEDDNFVGNFISAKYALMLGVVDLCTNIKIEGLDINTLISSGLWDKIKSSIKNYSELLSDKHEVMKAFADERIITHSMGTAFDKISIKINDFIENLDLSPEGLEKFTDTLKEASKDFDAKYKIE